MTEREKAPVEAGGGREASDRRLLERCREMLRLTDWTGAGSLDERVHFILRDLDARLGDPGGMGRRILRDGQEDAADRQLRIVWEAAEGEE